MVFLWNPDLSMFNPNLYILLFLVMLMLMVVVVAAVAIVPGTVGIVSN